MKSKLSLFSISMALCLLILPLSAQLSPKQIDRLVENAMEKFTVAGVAVGVVKDGEIVHARGYGLKSVDSNEKVDEQTSFAIASNSKAFTAAAVALLVEEGKLGWNDRVIDHIPEFKMYNDYVTQNFIVQDLLTHRSGLGLGAGDLQFWPSGGDFTMDDLLTNFQYFEPVSPFRTKYDYDNILYTITGELIKRSSGLSWEDFVIQRIMEPLGMDNSCTLPPGVTKLSNLASPHLVTDGELKTMEWFSIDHEKLNGALGGVLSNAEDMCKWLLLQLNHGKYGEGLNKQLFSETSQREMWKIHTTIPVRPSERYNPHYSGYGLGWRLGDMMGNMTVSHTGDYAGMLSKTIMLPDLDLGVVVLTNSYYGGGPLFQAVSLSIVDAYLGLKDYEWTEYYLERYLRSAGNASAEVERVWKVVEEGDHHGVIIENYLGLYEDPWFGKVEIYLKEGKPWFRSHRSPKLTGPMYHYKANAFAIKWEIRELDADAFVLFSLDEEGRARGISMKGVAPDLDFSYDFHDLNFHRVMD